MGGRLFEEDDIVSQIQVECGNSTETACERLLERWLKGEGNSPVTWRALVNAIAEIAMANFAAELKTVLSPD